MAGKEYTVDVYKTRLGRLLTAEDKQKAEVPDLFLSERMKYVEQEMEKKGLLALKNKKGKVLRLWYEVGKQLAFVMDTSVSK